MTMPNDRPNDRAGELSAESDIMKEIESGLSAHAHCGEFCGAPSSPSWQDPMCEIAIYTDDAQAILAALRDRDRLAGIVARHQQLIEKAERAEDDRLSVGAL